MYSYALDFKKIKLVLDNNDFFQIIKLKIINGQNNLSIKDYDVKNNTIEILLYEDINIKEETHIFYDNSTVKVTYFTLFSTETFNDRYYYPGELGCFYTNDGTSFKVWSPAAKEINLLVFKNPEYTLDEKPKKYAMKDQQGVFSTFVTDDIKGDFYLYEVHVYNEVNLAVDPYAKAVGVNGLRGAILDLKDTDPDGFTEERLLGTKNYTDAIIYETSVRDITSHPDSGVINRGKFLGLAEENTKSSKNELTGLSHILELGITHLQLMPFFDFSYTSVDEKHPDKYNWGYDPQNYNAPEGSYSTNPNSPKFRIKELKTMIQHLHKNGIHLNMDVVYNHVAFHNNNNFEKIFPSYYLRRNLDGSFSNGSSCSNDTASEHKMMQKFIIDSVLYWAIEYHIDGFRFDLMGLHDYETMNMVKAKLDGLDRNIMVYGEGWDLDTALPSAQKAIKTNCKKTPKIGYFNDIIRDVVKGHVFDLNERGFVSGKAKLENDLKDIILGTNGLFTTPNQSINYVSCHDNSTLWDKFEYSNKDYTSEEKTRMVKLSTAIVLTSQGVPFLHSGEEFLRTKFGEHNSFKSPDNINWMNWERKHQYTSVFEYFKGLVSLRKLHPAFRMSNYNDILNNISFVPNTPDNMVAYIIKNNANGDSWKNILVIFNANRTSTWITVPQEQWYLVVDESIAGMQPIKQIDSAKIDVSGLSMYLAYSL